MVSKLDDQDSCDAETAQFSEVILMCLPTEDNLSITESSSIPFPNVNGKPQLNQRRSVHVVTEVARKISALLGTISALISLLIIILTLFKQLRRSSHYMAAVA